MRVVVIIPSFYPAIVYGGSTFASYHLTKAAAESGVDLWVSTTNANGCERLDKEVNIFQSLDQFKIKYYHEELVNYFSSSFIFLPVISSTVLLIALGISKFLLAKSCLTDLSNL